MEVLKSENPSKVSGFLQGKTICWSSGEYIFAQQVNIVYWNYPWYNAAKFSFTDSIFTKYVLMTVLLSSHI